MDPEPYTINQVIVAMCPAIDRSDWRTAGAILSLNVFRLVPDGLTFDEWQVRVAELRALANRDGGPDRDGVLDWLDRELPGLMAAIPARGRGEFAWGVILIMIRDPETPIGGGRRRRRGRRRTKRGSGQPPSQ
jgi:hypothetical protein